MLHKFSLLSLHELCEQFQIGGTVERRELRDVLLLQRKEGGFVDANSSSLSALTDYTGESEYNLSHSAFSGEAI